jgi:hypothetical protein
MQVLESACLDWPVYFDDDEVTCAAELPPVPDRRYRSGLRRVWCGASLGQANSARELYAAVKKHAGEVTHLEMDEVL